MLKSPTPIKWPLFYILWGFRKSSILSLKPAVHAKDTIELRDHMTLFVCFPVGGRVWAGVPDVAEKTFLRPTP